MKKSLLKEKYLLYSVRQRKDAEAYGQLYDAYVDRIFRFIRFKVARTEEAEDLTSEVFLKTWEYLNSHADVKVQNFNALLYRVARNCVIDHYRRRRAEEILTDEEQMARIQDSRDLNRETEVKMEMKNLEGGLNKLKDFYREVLILKYTEELSVREIAEILDKKKGYVRVLIHRALKALKELTGED